MRSWRQYLATLRWGLLTAKEKVPSLLDGAGELFTPAKVPELLAQARLDQVELEFRAQVNTVVNGGLTPTHLDWHCLADGGRGDIFDLTVALAQEEIVVIDYRTIQQAWHQAGAPR